MARRARANLLNYGVSEAALAAFKADRDEDELPSIDAKAKGESEPGLRPDAQGRFEVRVSGAIVSDQEYDDQSKGAALCAPCVVRARLDKLPQGAPILLLLNSPGGNVHAAQEIGDMLDRWEGKVTCRITGLAASAGALLALMAADEIECTTMAKWMFHQASVAGLTSDGMRSMVDALVKTDGRQAALLAAGSSLSEEEAMAVITAGKDRWYDAAEAADLGLSSEVDPKPERRQEARMSERGRKEAALSRELMMMA